VTAQCSYQFFGLVAFPSGRDPALCEEAWARAFEWPHRTSIPEGRHPCCVPVPENFHSTSQSGIVLLSNDGCSVVLLIAQLDTKDEVEGSRRIVEPQCGDETALKTGPCRGHKVIGGR
jgi:hypothetical protein